jgi:hypothetical protein
MLEEGRDDNVSRRLKALAGYIWCRAVLNPDRNDAHFSWANSNLAESLERLNLEHGQEAPKSQGDSWVELGNSHFEVLQSAVQSDAALAGMLECLDRYDAFGYPHAVGSFEAHLIGTWHVLVCWRQPIEVTRCGLFHSVYSTDTYPRALIQPRSRSILRELIGEGAEALVFLFCTMDRQRAFRDIRTLGKIPDEGLPLYNSITRESFSASPRIAATYLIVELANLAEQTRAIRRGPGRWMATASTMANALRSHECVVPPIFNRCSDRLSAQAEARARALYYKSRRGHLLAAAKLNPWIAEPVLQIALDDERRGNKEEARIHALKAEELLLQWGTPWDKRVSWREMVCTTRRLFA